jgi:hypothetical protein
MDEMDLITASLPPSDFQTGSCNTQLTPEHSRNCNYLFTQVQGRNQLYNEKEFL